MGRGYVRTIKGLRPFEVEHWLRDMGFKTYRGVWYKPPIRVTLKKMVVRVDIELDKPVYNRFSGGMDRYRRVSSCYYTHLRIDDNGEMRGLGFTTHEHLHKLVYGGKERSYGKCDKE